RQRLRLNLGKVWLLNDDRGNRRWRDNGRRRSLRSGRRRCRRNLLARRLSCRIDRSRVRRLRHDSNGKRDHKNYRDKQSRKRTSKLIRHRECSSKKTIGEIDGGAASCEQTESARS